ncbi:MAG: GntR family transcriptional regulator [Deltaproteobacteria bacterium]|nr:GntR family transcriptional regulator [Deltaproteobacteria bacterium]
MKPGKPFHPARHTEYRLVTAILDGTYPPGSSLPSERLFAEQIGVTRQTLRETLQRLAAEGWVTIRHGKSTVVNDYWKEGGLGLLSSLTKYGASLPGRFITHLLEFRVILIPPVARLAIASSPEVFREYLNLFRNLGDDTPAFADYDWKLQVLFVKHSGNPIYHLILNDFSSIFEVMAFRYFSLKEGRESSRDYYLQLLRSIEQGKGNTEQIVRSVLEKSVGIWENVVLRNTGDMT